MSTRGCDSKPETQFVFGAVASSMERKKEKREERDSD